MTGKFQEAVHRTPTPSGGGRIRRVSVLRRKARTKDLLLLTELLRQLAACRAPMVEGLARTAADCPNNQASMHLNRLAEHMRAGESLSGAMRQSPKFFPRYYVDLVEVAETSNQLDTALAGLMHEVQSRHQAGHKVRNRIAYIVILLAYVVLVSSLLAGSTFTVLEDLTISFGGHIHGPADFGKGVMNYTGFLLRPFSAVGENQAEVFNKVLNSGGSPAPGRALGVFLSGAALSAVFLFVAMLLYVPCKYLFAQFPGVRRIILYAQWGHALNLLSLLLARGIALDKALDSAAGSDVHRGIRSTLRRLGGRVRSGQSLSQALEKERWRAPGSLRSTVAFGEHAGCLPESLSRVSHAYRLRAERAMRMLSNVLFPLAIMGCGVLVLAVHARFFGLLCTTMDTIVSQM